MILDKIVENKIQEVKNRKIEEPVVVLKERIDASDKPRDFVSGISKHGKEIISQMNLIAEIKKASPSAGVIKEDFSVEKIAEAYKMAKVDAVSVLTDKKFFQGEIKYLNTVKNVIDVPILRKDFIVDEYQIYESRAYKADAILLIVRILERSQLADYLAMTKELGMAALVEVHSEEELEQALSCNAEIIGINNRDLDTLEVDIETSLRIKGEVPENKIVVSESGIKTRNDVEKLYKCGIRAILVGEILMRSNNIKSEIQRLIGKEL
ncbi:indole-3-glycerol phosphate synthase TrpC [bacterium]|nr:indole-3-glycerol phosphate synthase TrpC [bacterium]